MKIAYLTTWPPRECGIANFTHDLATTIGKENHNINWEIIALNEPGTNFQYDNRVSQIIIRDKYQTYKKAADYVNNSDINLVVLEHEFGLFEPKSNLKEFLSLVKKPIVTTLHTVFFPEIYKTKYLRIRLKTLKKIIDNSDKIITMSQISALKIQKDFHLSKKRVVVIPHGAPDIKKIDQNKVKKQLGLTENHLLLSYGLIGKGKNFEQGIKAMSKILKKYPDTIYLIMGETHPNLSSGYMNFLKELVKKLHLKQNVRFINRYLTLKEIIINLQAADIFINTTNVLNLASSGTLAYALVAGKCIIATPFIYAKDILSEKKGIIVPVDDAGMLAKKVIDIFDHPQKRKQYENRTYHFGRNMIWSKIAKKYINLFETLT